MTVQIWVSLLQILAAFTVAATAAWIAWGQFRIARNKLKLDLFAPRMKVYEAVSRTVGKACAIGDITPEEEHEFLVSIGPSKWLFGEIVNDHLHRVLFAKLSALHAETMCLPDSRGEERTRIAHARADVLTYLGKHWRDFDDMMVPYLRIEG